MTERLSPKARLKLPLLDNEPTLLEVRLRRLTRSGMLIAVCASGAMLLAATLISVPDVVELQGTVRAHRVWHVRAARDGTIATILVAMGEAVQKYQPLVLLDSGEVARRRDKAIFDLDAQSIALRQAQHAIPLKLRQLEDERRLHETRAITARAELRLRRAEAGLATDDDAGDGSYRIGSSVRLDPAVAGIRELAIQQHLVTTRIEEAGLGRMEVSRLRAALKSDSIVLEKSHEELSQTIVRAPASGVVTSENLEGMIGQPVSAGATLFDVIDVSRWEVDAVVAESDLMKLRVGASGVVRILALDAIGTVELSGRLLSIGEEAVVRDNGATRPGYRARIALESGAVESHREYRLRPGLAATAWIVTGRSRLARKLIRRLSPLPKML